MHNNALFQAVDTGITGSENPGSRIWWAEFGMWRTLMKSVYALVLIAALACGTAFASGHGGATAPAEGDGKRYVPASAEQRDDADKVAVALAVGAFRPSDSEVRDRFGGTLTRFSLLTFEPEKPAETRFTWEAGAYSASRTSYQGGRNRVRLYTVGFGFQRGFGERANVRPYVVAHIGPYYGEVRVPLENIDESKLGLNLNACAGIIFNRRFYVEARYDYFSKIAGFDFSGFSIGAGVKLVDVKF